MKRWKVSKIIKNYQKYVDIETDFIERTKDICEQYFGFRDRKWEAREVERRLEELESGE